MSARVEAAAKAAHEFDTAHCPSFTWESAAEGWRKADRERQAAALAAADQIMFSEAAIERAAIQVFALNFDPVTWSWKSHENDRQSCRNLVRAVVAALREGHEPGHGLEA